TQLRVKTVESRIGRWSIWTRKEEELSMSAMSTVVIGENTLAVNCYVNNILPVAVQTTANARHAAKEALRNDSVDK
ncbi:hypothetical protein ACO1LT_15590, partial [Staphylococcus aureus]